MSEAKHFRTVNQSGEYGIQKELLKRIQKEKCSKRIVIQPKLTYPITMQEQKLQLQLHTIDLTTNTTHLIIPHPKIIPLESRKRKNCIVRSHEVFLRTVFLKKTVFCSFLGL